MTRPIRIGLYGDVDLNILDGSAIWLASLAEVLSGHPRVELRVLLKAPERRDLITGPLHDLPRTTLVRPAGAGPRLTQAEAVAALTKMDNEEPFDAVVLRGRRVAATAAGSQLAGRLWTYLTDIPQAVEDLTPADADEIARIVDASDRVLAQTEELRSYIEGICVGARRRTVLLPPMVPPVFEAPRHERPTTRPLRLFYAGKFAPMWGFLEAVDTFRRLRCEHPDLEFHVVGDKIHNPPDDPDFAPAVEAALASGDGLVWHGGTTREEVAALLRDADIALSARDAAMSDSLELSTKLLEYGAAGVPVVMNRTEMHERLYGQDYPLFIDDLDDLDGVLARAVADASAWERARDRVADVAAEYSFRAVRARLTPQLDRLRPDAPSTTRRPRVLVAGHDMRFFEAIRHHLEAAGADVRVDAWSGHEAHDPAASRDGLAWAETIICEWSLGNAEWYANRVRDDQRLIVRFHRQELETQYPGRMNVSAIDRIVFVSEHVQHVAVDRFGWADVANEVIPNAVDTVSLDRPKLPGSQHQLALVGFLPRLKGLARALDLLVLLRRHDPSYRLSLAGALPWSKEWIWTRAAERDYFTAQFDRIRRHRLLGDAVSFDGHVHDVGGWLRKIGVILSMSDLESFHLGLAEGMAARAVPLVRAWTGAAELYPAEWVHDTPEHAAAWLLDQRGRETEVGAAAREHIREHYDRDTLHARWVELVLG